MRTYALAMMVRLLAFLLALLALGAGGFGAALEHAPKHAAVKELRKSVASVAKATGNSGKQTLGSRKK